MMALTSDAARRGWTLETFAGELRRDPRALARSIRTTRRPRETTIKDLAGAIGFRDPAFVMRALLRRFEPGDARQVEVRIRGVLQRRRLWKYFSVPPWYDVKKELDALRAEDETEYLAILARVACVELGLDSAPEHPVFPPPLAALSLALKPYGVDFEATGSTEGVGREAAVEAHAAWRWLCQARGISEDSDDASRIWRGLGVPVEYQRAQVVAREGSAGPHVEPVVSRDVDFSPYPWREDHPLRKASSEELSRPGYGVVGYVDILDATKAAFREARQRICEQEARAVAAGSTRKPANQSSLDRKHQRETTTYRRKSGKRKQ
jgi:hypothetical protein